MPSLTLVTGGARSGKSAFAERLAFQACKPVIYLATATIEDEEMRVRVEQHRQRRPHDWLTVEAPVHVGAVLSAASPGFGTVLLDDLGLLVSNLLLGAAADGEPTMETAQRLEAAVADELEALWQAQAHGGWDLVMVTNEVGSGVVPPTSLGRVFRDALGRANQAVAGRADSVYLLVAGLPLRIKPAP
ncbi:MAG TPA: bifunctional adenosylcobinamide kinase/adenosylcobinamide-phosphate guanylyltransferase [Chloroflexota bacterium]|nr:bifunctional adenosylcobinamide kinase/adenosylcobinamide-phosphate guanylyltransferase [Chloroflexota bacterium]